MSRLLKLVHTVRYLKVKQVAYRIYYRVRKPKALSTAIPELRNVLTGWSAPSYMAAATCDGKTFTFLGHSHLFHGDWNSSDLPKLWLYNLHYFDDLNSIDADERFELCQALVDDWIEANPFMNGNGWEPYCLSLRVVNWVKWLSRLTPEQIKPEWIDSLAIQVDALDQQVEYHILANHLFANAKALVFAGAFFGGKTGDYWLQKGAKLLDQEVSEQFLNDGGHFELSPMYHSILLWDLGDLINLQQSVELPVLGQRIAEWTERFTIGMKWFQSMVHPDQDLSFFNDATLGIAPTLSNLKVYADHLGIEVPKLEIAPSIRGNLLQDTGYGIIDWPQSHRLIADIAKVGPDYQPGHAHADTLSCELSLFGQRVLVNSGISQYGEDAERHRQRSTAKHNTIEVDGENSSEVWAGFRVARRAKPFNVDLIQDEMSASLKASHDGYRRLGGNVIHHRHWFADPNSLTITDKLIGRFSRAVAYWHLHPDIKLKQTDDSKFEVTLTKGEVIQLEFTGADVEACESVWHPGFGLSVPNTKLVLRLSEQQLATKISWSLD
ncbi:MAG: alginate lyase family protein [Gammaproteobacteria bacterium]|nr:alginate lyase family protein [Gammaproteobacteria bacterium]